MARIVSEIGDELISSDAIALYELIKNSYDAQSPYVLVRVRVTEPPTRFEDVLALARNLWSSDYMDPAVEAQELQRVSPLLSDEQEANSDAFRHLDPFAFEAALARDSRGLSTIHIVDEGHGMDRATIEDAFLAIGTPMRLRQRQQQRRVDHATLGEKGVGRFSAKRLGKYLRVETK